MYKNVGIYPETHRILRMLAARRGTTMAKLLEELIHETGVKELGDGEVQMLTTNYKEHRIAILDTSPDPDQGPGGGVGEAEKRENLLGS